MANRGYGRSASVAAMRQHSIYFILPSGPSTDSTESGRVAPDAASESDRVPGALRAVAAQAPKHRLITRCGIGGDSQALYSLSIHYPLTNYLPMGMVVDNTTDVRRGKLALYESWGFPEVWVEVPEQSSPSRPAGLRPGLTIHLLEGGRFRTASSSRAFPSWTAQGNPPRAERARGVVRHHGRVAQGGTNARCGSRNRPGRRPVAARGAPAEPCRGPRRGPCRGPDGGPRGDPARCRDLQVLKLRGLPVSAAFPRRLAELRAASTAALVQAALECRDEADFLRVARHG